MNTVYIWCTFEHEGYHSWPDAPKEVDFLASRHRHIFKFKVWLEVKHEDREVEFILFKHRCKEIMGEFGHERLGSCESIGGNLLAVLRKEYAGRKMIAEVSEDGENGARIELTKVS